MRVPTLLLFLLVGCAHSQGAPKVRGSVVDAETGETLEGVEVFLRCTWHRVIGCPSDLEPWLRDVGDRVATTNPFGNFAGAPACEEFGSVVELLFVSAGYEPLRVSVGAEKLYGLEYRVGLRGTPSRLLRVEEESGGRLSGVECQVSAPGDSALPAELEVFASVLRGKAGLHVPPYYFGATTDVNGEVLIDQVHPDATAYVSLEKPGFKRLSARLEQRGSADSAGAQVLTMRRVTPVSGTLRVNGEAARGTVFFTALSGEGVDTEAAFCDSLGRFRALLVSENYRVTPVPYGWTEESMAGHTRSFKIPKGAVKQIEPLTFDLALRAKRVEEQE